MRVGLAGLLTLLAVQLAITSAQARRMSAAAEPAARPSRRILLANDTGSGNATSGSTAPGRKRCRPSLIDVARTHPELRQSVQLAAAGYNMYSVDGGKPFTLMVPTNSALQQLAAGVGSVDEQLSLEDGFYSILLYHQIPQGAYNVSQLLALGDGGLDTSLRVVGSADDKYTVSLDGSTRPVVVTGGWPANNVRLVASEQACNGWLHIVDGVLLPTQSLSDLPRLVDDTPDLKNGSFWSLLDGSLLATGAPSDSGDGGDAPAAESPSPAPSAANDGPHSNTTGITVSSGNGTAAAPDSGGGSSGASSGGGGSENVLIIAASVAGAAVATCAAVVSVVLLRKHAARRRRKLDRLEAAAQQEEDSRPSPTAKRASSARPLQLHVDA